MNERTRLLGDAEHPHDDQPYAPGEGENNLWTRRSALALTAGFLAARRRAGAGAFVQPALAPRPTTSSSPSRTGCSR